MLCGLPDFMGFQAANNHAALLFRRLSRIVRLT
jgi:hypothetical protein